jgi:hypothetical protein
LLQLVSQYKENNEKDKSCVMLLVIQLIESSNALSLSYLATSQTKLWELVKGEILRILNIHLYQMQIKLFKYKSLSVKKN